VIIHGPPNKCPANSTSGSSSSSSSAKTKGMYQRRTTLGDGRVVETRVSVRNQNKPVSKHQRIRCLSYSSPPCRTKDMAFVKNSHTVWG
jgi:hypothetical protein